MSTSEESVLPIHPNQRRKSSKVKTGCLTCKLRRIKCDETKPSCLRCRASGRECGGYPMIKTLTFEICSDADEKRSFFFYRDQTLQHLNSFNEYRFWDRLVIQASYSHEAVRRMVVAIGAFNEAIDHSDGEAGQRLQTMALEQYSRALEQTVSKIGHIPPEHLLIAALMFSFFENIRGYPMAALRHLYSGISLLLQHQRGTSRVSVIEDELRPILALTHIRASSLYPQVLQLSPTAAQVSPAEFSSMRDAHLHFFHAAQRISSELDRAYRERPWSQPELSLGPKFLTQLDSWRERFVEFINSRQSACDCSPPFAQLHFELGSLYLQSQYLSTVIRLQAGMTGSDMVFDARTEAVNQIVNLCEQMVRMMQMPGLNQNDTASCLGFTPAVISTLAMLGLRCRDPATRRRIVSLMRSAPSERSRVGNALAADVVEHVMNVEEGVSRAHPVREASDIPAEARITIAATTVFQYSSITRQFELLSDYSSPDLVRIRYLRLGDPSLAQGPGDSGSGYETLWLDRRDVDDISEVAYPEDVQPLFPQILTTHTNLFSRYGLGEEMLMTRRASLCQIFVPPVTLPRMRVDETPPRSFVINSVALGLMGAGDLARSRSR